MIDEAIPREVLAKAGLPHKSVLSQVKGGFSTGAVWRVACEAGVFTLKRYPPPMTVHRLETIHQLIDAARSAGIAAIPEIQRFSNLRTTLEHSGAVWEVTTWQPGRAILNANPTPARLAAVGEILGRLHTIWGHTQHRATESPAVQRRLAALATWNTEKDPVSANALDNQITLAVNSRVQQLQTDLTRWTNRDFIVQACLCDSWYAHFLFIGDEITGLIDHGNVQEDLPVVDLARLLGSLDLTAPQRETVLDSYHRRRSLSLEDLELMTLLERSGIICTLIFWYLRIDHGESISDAGIERIRFMLARASGLT